MTNKAERQSSGKSDGAANSGAEILEDFIERFNNGDLALKPEIYEFPFQIANAYKGNLGEALATSISNYLSSKRNKDPNHIAIERDKAIACITLASNYDFIVKTQSMLDKLENARLEIRQLKEEKAQLESKLLLVQKENEDWHKWMENFNHKILSKSS